MTNIVSIPNIASLRNFSEAGPENPVVWVESYNSLGDGGEGVFIYNPNNTSSIDNDGTIIVISNSTGTYRYFRQFNNDIINICWFGGGNNEDSTQALSNALSVISLSNGGTVYFPAGTYTFYNEITYKNSNSDTEFSLTFVGQGADSSILYWPNETNGLSVYLGASKQSVHFRDLSITTSQTGIYTGIYITQVGGGGVATGVSDFTRVNFRGSSPQLQYWGTAISVNNMINVNYEGVIIAGSLPNTNVGIGVNISGTSPNYSLGHNFTNCVFYSGEVGIIYGTYSQGITVNQCNFGTFTGVRIPEGETSIAQLSIVASQFGCSGYGVDIRSLSSGITITGNTFYYPDDISDTIGIYMNYSGTPAIQGTAIVGNFFSGHSIPGNSGKGIVVSGNSNSNNYGNVTGNVFDNMNTGVDLTGAQLWNVHGNIYGVTIPNQVVPGNNNSVGVTTK
ncbi:hypothetical protein SRCM100623_00278 [Acetobacter pasteurianus]|uniref:Pectate lyase superfamily protein domain-containing protein n=1 Tax=Acetobacter pasteurianus TaxID=438 RepID=A0A1A0DM53_ACEPA|nr:hypothetical protein [Acetobacter pasteurianus]OAZ76100.1 hypothetical protein SRCM100623_00278 [Acetobacter pasteurianus]